MENEGVRGRIVRADLFEPPGDLVDAFDVVFSMGVIEHFDNTEDCCRALNRFLKDRGTAITVVPNLAGFPGWIQKRINRPVYDLHKILDARSLRIAHERAGFETAECGFFMSTNFGVLNTIGLPEGTAGTRLKQALLKRLSQISKIFWGFERAFGRLPQTRLFSPYIVYRGVKRP